MTSDRTRRVPPWVLAVAVAALVVTVAAVVLAVRAQGRASDLEAEVDRREEAVRSAARFAEVYLSYDAGDVEGSRAAILELVTDAFAEDFDSNRAPGLEELFANLGASTEAAATGVYLGDHDDRGAQVLVVVDVVASSEATGTQQLSNLTFLLHLVREDGTWVVDEVLPAPQPDVTGDGVETGTTETTPTTETNATSETTPAP